MENEITLSEENSFLSRTKDRNQEKEREKKTQSITYRKELDEYTWGKLILFTASLLRRRKKHINHELTNEKTALYAEATRELIKSPFIIVPAIYAKNP